MIGRKNRYQVRASIQRLYKNGKSVRSGTLALRYAQNPKRREYRVAVVVSRKVSKSAVVRNRIRRRIYERVRILSIGFTAAYDLAFTVFDEKIATLPPSELDAEIVKLVKKAGISSAKPTSHGIVEARKKI
jgi:ribonuclease P protein component